jgi:hypothetical protein
MVLLNFLATNGNDNTRTPHFMRVTWRSVQASQTYAALPVNSYRNLRLIMNNDITRKMFFSTTVRFYRF